MPMQAGPYDYDLEAASIVTPLALGNCRVLAVRVPRRLARWEVSHQLKDSGARILFTIAAFLETAKAAVAGEIFLMREAEGATPLTALLGKPLGEQAPIDAARDMVVLPYSSGTTGLPKGVRLSHRNLVANVEQCLAVIGCAPGEWSVGLLGMVWIG